jgi:hypothetical protein
VIAGAPDPAARGGDADPLRVLSGESGIVTGRRQRLRAMARDLGDDAAAWARMIGPRLERDARAASAGEVLVLGIYAGDHAHSMARAVAEMGRSRRRVRFALGALGSRAAPLAKETLLDGLAGAGKFENINSLLTLAPPGEARWVVVMDDDARLPRGFLDRFLFLAERFDLQLAQPAHRHASHAAWRVLRRERGCVARVTRMVEIGPLTAFHASVAAELLPFPPLRMGWGLDSHWAALALERGWRLGVVDATPIRHGSRVTASAYDRGEAVEEMRRFLAGRPHIDRDTASTVVERHRRW